MSHSCRVPGKMASFQSCQHRDVVFCVILCLVVSVSVKSDSDCWILVFGSFLDVKYCSVQSPQEILSQACLGVTTPLPSCIDLLNQHSY